MGLKTLVPPLLHPILSSKYTIAALCTRSEEPATAAAKKYFEDAGRTVRAYYGEGGVHALVHDSEVDMVAVSVKIPDHFKVVMQVIEAGKDLFVEWTPGKGYDETRRIQEAAKTKGVRALVGAQFIQSAAIKKVKQLIDAGRVGRVLSTTAIVTGAGDFQAWGASIYESLTYLSDIDSDADSLTILIGLFITALDRVLGPFTQVTASGAIRYATSQLIDAGGKPTGKTSHNTAHDNVCLTGTLQGGTFVNVHCRAGVTCGGERGKGRTMFQWIIDGEDGTIEVVNREEDGIMGAYFTLSEKDVYVNGERVALELGDIDKLGQAGKAWYEFAREESKYYTSIDDAERVHRVLDAAKTSILEGRRVIL